MMALDMSEGWVCSSCWKFHVTEAELREHECDPAAVERVKRIIGG